MDLGIHNSLDPWDLDCIEGNEGKFEKDFERDKKGTVLDTADFVIHKMPDYMELF